MPTMPARRLPYLRRTGGRTAEGTGLLNRGQAMETKDLGAAHALGMGQPPHTAAIELAEVDAGIIDWATEVKETGSLICPSRLHRAYERSQMSLSGRRR